MDGFGFGFSFGLVAASSSISSAALALLAGEDGLAIDFTDAFHLASTGFYGSAAVVGGGTRDGYNTSLTTSADSLLTYTSSPKLTRQSDGVFRHQAHNLFLNTAAPANQSITVLSGATYAVILTGTVTTTLSGAATGTITAGTTNITAATATLTFGSTSGAGTVQVTRTPASLTFLATTGTARYSSPDEWDTSGSPLGMMVESARTNLLLRSSEFANASWPKSAITVTANTIAAPNGFMVADTLAETAATAGHVAFQTTGATAAATYTFSVFLKSNGRNANLWLRETTTGNIAEAFFNLSEGSTTVTGMLLQAAWSAASSTITDVGNGWYFCTYTATTSGTAAKVTYIFTNNGTGSNPSYLGDGTSGVFAWNAQLELGSTASSPIETFGSTVTRAADVPTLAASAFPVSDNMTVAVTFSPISSDPSFRSVLVLGSANNQNRFDIAIQSGFERLSVASGNVLQSDAAGYIAAPVGSRCRIAFASGPGVLRASYNGGAAINLPALSAPYDPPILAQITQLSIGHRAQGLILGGYIESIVIVPRTETALALPSFGA